MKNYIVQNFDHISGKWFNLRYFDYMDHATDYISSLVNANAALSDISKLVSLSKSYRIICHVTEVILRKYIKTSEGFWYRSF